MRKYTQKELDGLKIVSEVFDNEKEWRYLKRNYIGEDEGFVYGYVYKNYIITHRPIDNVYYINDSFSKIRVEVDKENKKMLDYEIW